MKILQFFALFKSCLKFEYFQGDQGGPIICQVQRDPDILIGIAANVNIYKDCNKYSISTPGIFTNVGKYVPWIKTEIEDDERRNRNANGGSMVVAKITITLIICAIFALFE